MESKKERQRLGLPSIGEQSLHMSFLGNPGTGPLRVRFKGFSSLKEGSLRGSVKAFFQGLMVP